MADTLQRLLTPRHACLCLEIGAQARSWDCIQGELSALSEDGACVILDGDIGTLPSQQGHLSLKMPRGISETPAPFRCCGIAMNWGIAAWGCASKRQAHAVTAMKRLEATSRIDRIGPPALATPKNLNNS